MQSHPPKQYLFLSFSFLLVVFSWGCHPGDATNAVARFETLQQEHQRVIKERDQCQTATLAEGARSARCQVELEQCQAQPREEPSKLSAPCPKTIEGKVTKPLRSVGNPPAMLAGVLQASAAVTESKRRFLEARARLPERQKAVERAEKAVEKQQRPLGRERKEGSEEYVKAYPDLRKALDFHTEVLKAYHAAQKEADQAEQALLTAVQMLQDKLQDLETSFQQTHSPAGTSASLSTPPSLPDPTPGNS